MCVTPLKIVYFFDQHSVKLYVIFVYVAFTGKHSMIMYVNSAFLSRYGPIRNSCDYFGLAAIGAIGQLVTNIIASPASIIMDMDLRFSYIPPKWHDWHSFCCIIVPQ